MGVSGELQIEGEVIHVIARQLTDHSEMLGNLVTISRDFR
jgi:error-prone DNA polymerase